ncbi:hypothetical protein [Luteolibacter sp. AS25]|uniref:hypothetical protein n=1 Tax=Luteolibacter sp. AS25 TaxID=3135776 RepID=UPI00398B565E
MSQSAHNASIQASATREAARQQSRATAFAAQKQIEHETAVREAKEVRLKECIEAYASLDESALFRKSDKDLAHFQATHPPESPQYALAINEWNRRLIARQIKSTRFSAFIGFIGIIIGALIGWGLSSTPAPQLKIPEYRQVEDQPKDDKQRKNPNQVPPQTKTQPDTE